MEEQPNEHCSAYNTRRRIGMCFQASLFPIDESTLAGEVGSDDDSNHHVLDGHSSSTIGSVTKSPGTYAVGAIENEALHNYTKEPFGTGSRASEDDPDSEDENSASSNQTGHPSSAEQERSAEHAGEIDDAHGRLTDTNSKVHCVAAHATGHESTVIHSTNDQARGNETSAPEDNNPHGSRHEESAEEARLTGFITDSHAPVTTNTESNFTDDKQTDFHAADSIRTILRKRKDHVPVGKEKGKKKNGRRQKARKRSDLHNAIFEALIQFRHPESSSSPMQLDGTDDLFPLGNGVRRLELRAAPRGPANRAMPPPSYHPYYRPSGLSWVAAPDDFRRMPALNMAADTDHLQSRYEDGEVRRYGAGESYRPFNRERDRSPRPGRSLSRERERERERDRARSPPGASDRYIPNRSPRRRSRSHDRFRRDRSRDVKTWRRGDRTRSRSRARSPLRCLSPRRTPPRRGSPRFGSPRRDERNDRPRSPRRDFYFRDPRSVWLPRGF